MVSIEVSRLSVSYAGANGAVNALSDVSLSIEPGEFACLVGPSGCGKTTLLNVLAGFVAPTSGAVQIGGKPVTADGVDRGIVFQDFAQLFPWRTALGNIEFGLEMKGVPAAKRRQIARDHLKMVNLERFEDAYPHTLSGGMQQRVAIARALAFDPPVLLMDEPFAALDAMTRDSLQRLLEALWSATRKTIVYVTHNVSEAVYLANRVFVFSPHPGRLQATIPIALARPREALGVDFLEQQRRVVGELSSS